MPLDVPTLRAEYEVERPYYERLADLVARLLCDRLQSAGLHLELQSRAKDVPSFLRKAIRKKYANPLQEINDKVGIRLLVANLDQRQAACAAIESLFHPVMEREDLRERLGPDQLGYMGIHYLVTPSVDALGPDDEDLRGRIAEIQVHTRAQHAWSENSHELIYKPLGPGPSPTLQRRVLRAMALIELFDEEIQSARRMMMSDAHYRPVSMLTALKRIFMTLAPRDYDVELSMQVLDVIREAYDEPELERFDELLSAFEESHHDIIAAVYQRYGSDQTADPLLFQPESIAIFERLERRPQKLEAVWRRELDVTLLESLAAVFGRPLRGLDGVGEAGGLVHPFAGLRCQRQTGSSGGDRILGRRPSCLSAAGPHVKGMVGPQVHNLAEKFAPMFYGVRYQVEAWERSRLASDEE